MLPIEYGDGYLKDLDQRSEVRAAQVWLNVALDRGGVSLRVSEDGRWGHGSQAALDALRRTVGLEDATGTALTVETLAVLGIRLNHPWTEPAPPEPPDAPGELSAVQRSAWGARDFRGRPQRLGDVRGLVVHHTAGSSLPASAAEGAEEVRLIQRLHQGQGWADIGYHLLLAQDGTWFQGRP